MPSPIDTRFTGFSVHISEPIEIVILEFPRATMQEVLESFSIMQFLTISGGIRTVWVPALSVEMAVFRGWAQFEKNGDECRLIARDGRNRLVPAEWVAQVVAAL